MFVLHDFILRTLMDMVGRELDYKVRRYALDWLDKGQLQPEDLVEVDKAIQQHHDQLDAAQSM